MKTSILISSFAALCLLVTFADAPRRYGENKMNAASTENISVTTVRLASMLTGVTITADKKKETGISIPVLPAEDFSYLKFDVADYMEADAATLNKAVILPEAIEKDYSYLKFKLSDFNTDSEISSDEITELPESENGIAPLASPEPARNEFSYLRFDVNDYIGNSLTDAAGTGELPSKETTYVNQNKITAKAETTLEFSYLKFDASEYYNPADQSYNDQIELPEK